MAKRTPFTAQQERLERLIKNLQNEVADIKTMVDVERGILTAQLIKVDDPSSPQIIRVSEGGSLDLGSESGMRVLGVLTEAVSHTGDLVETELFKVTVPANSMGPNGVVRISSAWHATKIPGGVWFARVYFGAALISKYGTTVAATLESRPVMVWNKNNTGAQRHVDSFIQLPIHFSGGVHITDRAVDTTADVDITFKAICGNAGDEVFLHYAMVEALYRD